jgi:hypothetical protein
MKSIKIIIREANGKKISMNLEGKALDAFREVFLNDKEFMDKYDSLYSQAIEKFQEKISDLPFHELVNLHHKLRH